MLYCHYGIIKPQHRQVLIWVTGCKIIFVHMKFFRTMAHLQQRMVFLSLYVSYMLYVYVRRSVTFSLPEIAKTESLDKNQLGMILSGQMLAYAVSKFFSGVLIDFISPRVAMSVSLVFVGVTAILFAGVHESVVLFSLLWIANGLFQGPGWPAAAIIMKKWFKDEQFGTAWGVLSTSMNVAGTVGPLVTALLVTQSGWRSSLLLPGILSVVWGLFQYLSVKDQPLDYSAQESQKKSDKAPKMLMSRRELLNLPGYLGVCVTYFVVSVVQFGFLQWGPVYLVNDLGHSIVTGNSYTSSLEVGGIVGSLLAGYYSDYLVLQRPSEPSQNVRQYVIAWFTSGLAGFLYIFSYCISQYSSLIWVNIIGFGIGMTIYGPISMYGVTAIQCAPSEMAGTSHAIAGLFASVGQSVAGLPLSYVAKFLGWRKTFFIQFLLVVVMTGYLFVYTKSCYSKREVESENKKSQ